MKLGFYPQIFENSSNIEFRENPSSVSPVGSCGDRGMERQTNGQTYMTKIIAAFRNFANVLKN
jgi:hypothetical protein